MGHMRSRARCLCGRGVLGMRVRMGVARLVINQAKQLVVEVVAHGRIRVCACVRRRARSEVQFQSEIRIRI